MDDELKGEGNAVNYRFRMHDPRLGRFFSIDPLAAKYPYNSTYAFSENRVIDGVELEGLEYKATKDKESNYSGFEWDPDNAYDDNGNLNEGYFEKAILFKDNGSWSSGNWQEGKNRYSSFNIGSAEATVYTYSESLDDEGNTVKTQKSQLFNASTMPSDPTNFANIKPGLYQAVRHKHRGKYWALQLQTLSGSNKIPVVGGVNPAKGGSTASGVNIHKAGIKNYTGTFWSGKRTYNFSFKGITFSSSFKSTYSGVSEGCQLIDCNQWESFMDLFPSGSHDIGVIINRSTYSTTKLNTPSAPGLIEWKHEIRNEYRREQLEY
jgi:hypothetical protein